MPKQDRDPVGKSGVTPCKHLILDELVGQICGCLSTGKIPVNGATFYDLTAGDGIPQSPTRQSQLSMVDLPDPPDYSIFERHCSPGIYLKHLTVWANRKRVMPLRLVMSEKQAATFATLQNSTSEYMDRQGWQSVERGIWRNGSASAQLLHCDARDVSPPGRGRGHAAHIYCDPNHIESWALTPEFLHSCPSFTTSVSTLGCNVNGLKRIELDRRELWYERINQLTSALVRSWHDACLLSVGDCSQWAYLITAPVKWREKVTTTCLKAAARIEGRKAQPQLVWMGQDPDGYRRLQDYLFLTHNERKVAA